MDVTTELDTLDPLSTQALEVTVTDPLNAGAAVTTATVTALLTRADGSAFVAPLNTAVSLTHVSNGLYRVLIPPASFASANLTLTTGRAVIDYTATITGTDPLVVRAVRQPVTIARTIDT